MAFGNLALILPLLIAMALLGVLRLKLYKGIVEKACMHTVAVLCCWKPPCEVPLLSLSATSFKCPRGMIRYHVAGVDYSSRALGEVWGK